MPRPKLDERDVAAAIHRAGRQSIDPRVHQAVPDLSTAAIAERRRQREITGAELIDLADRVYHRAALLAKVASRSTSSRRRRDRASAAADQALVTAAVQIRLAELTPVTTSYLHAVSIDQIQTVKADVSRVAGEDMAALAVDTHRRIAAQKTRRSVEQVERRS